MPSSKNENCQTLFKRHQSELERLLPVHIDPESSAREYLAIQRTQRKLRSAMDLLRVVLAYGFCGLSFQDTALWARTEGIADLSDVAVLKAVRRCGDWLGYLLGVLLAERAHFQPTLLPSKTVRLFDASTVSEPGSNNADWRLHLGYDLGRGCVDEVHLTTQKVGEHLARFQVRPGEIAVGDRAFATRAGLMAVLEAGADFIVRLNWSNVPLFEEDGSRFDLFAALRALADDQVGDFSVSFIAPSGQLVACRLVAQRLPESKREAAVARARRNRRKSEIQPETLEAAEYIFVLTSLQAHEVGASDVLAIYRLRWQVELVFKRLKSLLDFDELPADHPKTARSFLLAKLLGAMIVEERAIRAVSAFPPGHDARPVALQAHATAG
jgi:hypothetical protein